MIPIPPHAVRGQVLTADLLNRILDALRRCRPLQGQGILLKETANGVILEATAKTAQAATPAAAAATHQPFELRVRKDNEGTHWLDVYEPQGTRTQFIDATSQNQEELPLSWSGALQDLGDGWHTLLNLDTANFENGLLKLCIQFSSDWGFVFKPNPTLNPETNTATIGQIKRVTGDATTYNIHQIALGALRIQYAWRGAEALMTQKDAEWTADLTGIDWTPTTPLILARLHSTILSFASAPQGETTLEHPCAQIPKGKNDNQFCFAAKIDATPHAADHIQDLLPFAEENA